MALWERYRINEVRLSINPNHEQTSAPRDPSDPSKQTATSVASAARKPRTDWHPCAEKAQIGPLPWSVRSIDDLMSHKALPLTSVVGAYPLPKPCAYA